MSNKGNSFSRHQKGDEGRLRKWLGSPFCSNDGRLTQALSTLSPGETIPKHPHAYEEFLTRGE